MRRPSTSLLPDFPKDLADLNASPHTKWRASFPLVAITPVVGGGVESAEPDTVDVVRIPGIRGQLRHWWRFLYARGSTESADALFKREAVLWGGVGVPEPDGEAKSHASRVRLGISALDAGKLVPAGHHEVDHRGRLRSLPRWSVGTKLAYALFPLQRSFKERKCHQGSGSLPTRPLRLDLRFTLEVEVRAGQRDRAEDEPDVDQVLATIWAWVHLGGLGARTRRGFGALAMKGRARLDELASGQAWRELFQGPAGGGLARWWSRFGDLAWPDQKNGPPARFSETRLLHSDPSPHADRAHEELIGLLAAFRQGPDIGRDPGDGRQPGESRWPEPHLLRLQRKAPEQWRNYEHPPTREAIEAFEAEDETEKLGAPRAAFGLPLQIRFKYNDHRDKQADATLLPANTESQRWASPLVLRPVRTAEGTYCPLAVLLGGERPPEVRIEFREGPSGKSGKKARASGTAGARPPIRRHLAKAEGDALEAFAGWLEAEHGYRRLRSAASQEGRHG